MSNQVVVWNQHHSTMMGICHPTRMTSETMQVKWKLSFLFSPTPPTISRPFVAVVVCLLVMKVVVDYDGNEEMTMRMRTIVTSAMMTNTIVTSRVSPTRVGLIHPFWTFGALLADWSGTKKSHSFTFK